MVSFRDLKEFELFSGLNDTKLAKIAKLCEKRTLEDGALCFKQGNKALGLHLCHNGKINILYRIHEPWAIEVITHAVKAGEVFGWSALVEPHIYTASAKCVGKVEEIYIVGAELRKLLDANPAMGYVVMKNLSTLMSSRLTETRRRLTKEIAASINKEW